MDYKEMVARKKCANSNFCSDCDECSHRKWPEGDWVKKPMFDPTECRDWIDYISRLQRIKDKIIQGFKGAFSGPTLPGNV